MSTTNPMVQFKFGEYSGFKGLTQYDAGTLYVTTDEQGIYFAKDKNTAIKLGNIITYNSLKDWNENTKPPYSADVFYYITDTNALIKYDTAKEKFIQLNKDYGSDVSSILTAIGAVTDTVAAGKTSLWAKINEAKATADAASTAASAADSKAQEARNVADSALQKANTNGNSISTINGQINTINSDIETLQGIVVTGNNSNDKLRAAITENGTAITTAQTRADNAYTLAETADGKADDNADAISDINDAIGTDDTTGTLKGRIKANETAISNINTAIGSDTTPNSIKGRIKANEGAIAEHSTAISNIQSTYATKTYAESEADAAETAAKGYADQEIAAAKTALIGTEVTGNTSTIKGVKKYTDEQIGIVATSVTTLSNQIGNLSNIMNFRGTYATLDAASADSPVHGDVIIVGGVEYVYVKPGTDAGKWEEFGAASANEARFQAIEERVTALDQAGTGKIALIEGRLDSAEDRLTDTEGVANGAATGVNALNDKVDTLEKTTIPAIEAKIGTVAEGQNLASLIAAEESRAKGIEGGLQSAINTINNTTVPAINTAHNNLAARVTALDKADGRVAAVEADVSTLKTKTGIANLTGNDTLYSLITAEKARAEAEEADIRADFAAEDVLIRTEINAMLTWGSF